MHVIFILAVELAQITCVIDQASTTSYRDLVLYQGWTGHNKTCTQKVRMIVASVVASLWMQVFNTEAGGCVGECSWSSDESIIHPSAIVHGHLYKIPSSLSLSIFSIYWYLIRIDISLFGHQLSALISAAAPFKVSSTLTTMIIDSVEWRVVSVYYSITVLSWCSNSISNLYSLTCYIVSIY